MRLSILVLPIISKKESKRTIQKNEPNTLVAEPLLFSNTLKNLIQKMRRENENIKSNNFLEKKNPP